MLDYIIQYSIRHKLIILLFSSFIVGFGIYSLANIPIGAVPDVTNNQVQIITTSRNLATEDVEKFLTYPVELEMANLPNVTEIRSVSKFGLSVVTVVFDDAIGTYLPRQLIAEKIKSAEEKIPVGFGKPFMGPISTGLGEIYQYVIDIDSAYRDQYSLSDIRTIQDWIVKRQLSGIPGVVEVNTWGGYLKQYEVAIDPERLKSLGIPLTQAFQALSQNNSIAGGGYIEKMSQAYFIRGEGLIGTLEDIEQIVVDNRGTVPIYMKDIATVGFGRATRFGAITGNGEGEKVLGQVMMLKGANSKAVIEAVKERVASIQSSLPKGIYINPILERSELIGKTTFTIAENLILGCLIVVFVVVLLLGNLRSGLVVASVIPMCLLFALSLMYIFGVDANLMSLGAIDFGIIIDGAVIIVEFIAFEITQGQAALLALPPKERQGLIDEITYKGASKMMHSAVFGQLIIIIVFIPILSLVGVEGKMFRPMALVFCFALIGAMLLCFTYVPVMAALFIKPAKSNGKGLSARLMNFFENLYQPTIALALRYKAIVLGLALGIFASVVVLFANMGGEFVPTLDEGDFVIQPVLKTGTSLEKTVEATTQIEQILRTFPEVAQVVSRIGAAEVPTDPMSMEESDVIIKLKPKSEWITTDSKDALADHFKEALASKIPGVEFEFTQPIEMRFNELITGVRADLAIKIFGEDLDVLYKKALEVEKAISGIEGAADISVEKVAGLPQMSVKYHRKQIAKYGLNIEELNQMMTIAFAGMGAGTVFEGEKQFDLVMRFDEAHRQGLESLSQMPVWLPNGQNLPLSEFATISYSKGPAKISRDDTKRRVVVGVNVRGRDLASVVADAQVAIAKQVKLPTGYTIAYGGQFENLETAKQRLLVAVPIALLLIFVLLYFAFSSVKEAAIIYTAIPLSAIGGVWLLYLRDLPFSISAGVGFIALFGIAVLNGIVLIEEFKELKEHGVSNVHRRILIGTRKRLRPVLLTAAAAALGFLPMAISTSAGAEVQRPLATVVVGGLISATALTLLVLPVLYALFDNKTSHQGGNLAKGLAVLLGMCLLPQGMQAQGQEISQAQAIEIAIQNNQGLKAASQRSIQSEQLIGSATDIGKTQLYYSYDENNIALNNLPLKVWGMSQSIEWPGLYAAKKRLLQEQSAIMAGRYGLVERKLAKEVSKAYAQVVYAQQSLSQYAYLDSLYGVLAQATDSQFKQGEANSLEAFTALAKKQELGLKLKQLTSQLDKAYALLYQHLQTDVAYTVPQKEMERLAIAPMDLSGHPEMEQYSRLKQASEQALIVEKRKALPDWNFSVFRGSNRGTDARNYMGFEVGMSVPIWMKAQKARVQVAQTSIAIIEAERENHYAHLQGQYQRLLSDITQQQEAMAYYEETGKALATALIDHGTKAFQQGEIDAFRYIQLLEHAQTININYLTALYQHNMAVLEANYLIND